MSTTSAPESFGWERINDALVPIMTDNLPAPLALIELSVCECKSHCKTNRCRCHKNSFLCTDMFKYTNCENNDDGDEDSDLEPDDED